MEKEDPNKRSMPCNSESLLEMAGRLARIGGWAMELPHYRMRWSEEMRSILEFAECAEPSIEALLSLYTPASRKLIARAFKACARDGSSFEVEIEVYTANGRFLNVYAIGQAVRDGSGRIVRVEGIFQDVTEKRQAERMLLRNQRRFRQIADTMPHIVWTAQPDGMIDYANKAMTEYLGGAVARGRGRGLLNALHPDDVGRCLAAWRASIRTGSLYSVEYRARRHGDGSYRWHLVRALPVRDRNGKIVKWYGTATDIDDSKQAELDLARSNRVLRMTSACSELLIRATDEMQTLAEICRIAVEVGGYRTAWVVFTQDDESSSVRTVAHAGDPGSREVFSAGQPSWQEQTGGTGSGAVLVFEDVTRDPLPTGWVKELKKQGERGLVCLPLRDRERTFGFLALCGSEVRPVAAEEIGLLQKLADDLAFGIGDIRSQAERRRVQAAVSKIAASVSASSGTEFFAQLALTMAEAVGAHAGLVARMLPDQPDTIRTVAAVQDGVLVDNFDYAVKGTPCEAVLRDGHCILSDAVGERPAFRSSIAGLDARSYVGGRLDNSLGQTLGLLFVMFRKPLERSAFIMSTLEIFAARAAAELERQEVDARMRDQASLLDKAQDAIIVCGVNNRVLYWNDSAERLYGWAAEEVLGKPVAGLIYDDAALLRVATDTVLDLGEWCGEITQRRRDGSSFPVEGHWTLVRDEDGKPKSILSINTDITRRKAAEREIQQLAFYDPLTRLPNRLLLLDRLQHALAMSARSGQMGSLLFIDLDNFKRLNDTLGHDKGDLLLQQVAVRLSSCVRESNTVARLGGDEFVVILEELSGNPQEAAAQTETVGEKILAAFQRPYQLGGHAHYSTPSIGAALFIGQSSSADELLKRADLAMYQAKAAGRNAIRFFDPQMQTVVAARAALEADLRQALRDKAFLLHYQARIDSDGNLSGAEALVRWQHPLRGMLSPPEFIALAEETGLSMPLGQWVLETACAQLAAWAASPETARLCVDVNISARQFRHPGFVAQVLAALARSGASPHKLTLEFTEAMLVDHVEDTIAKMTALKAKGVRFSLDDFGTSYSSLSGLKRLPLDQLKIDRSLVSQMLTVPNDAVVVRAIIAVGKSLGMAVIAEGVETDEQRDFLARHHCHAYQGYLFGPPRAAEQFEASLRQTRNAISTRRTGY